MAWQTPNSNQWFIRLIRAFWNAQGYLWNDTVCTWDAISTSDDWKTENAGTWYTRN